MTKIFELPSKQICKITFEADVSFSDDVKKRHKELYWSGPLNPNQQLEYNQLNEVVGKPAAKILNIQIINCDAVGLKNFVYNPSYQIDGKDFEIIYKALQEIDDNVEKEMVEKKENLTLGYWFDY